MEPLDLLQAVSHPDPYPAYRTLREGPPVVFDPRLQTWIVTRAATITRALATPALRVRPTAEPVPRPLVGTPCGEWFGQLVRMNDGPDRHDAPKAGLERALAAVDLADVANQARRAAATVPWSPAWSFEVPVRAVAGLLGFDEALHADVARWVGDLVSAIAPGAAADTLARGQAAAGALSERMATLLHTPARAGSVVARVQAADGLSQAALRANLVGLLSQTHDATAGLLGNSLVALARGAGAGDLGAVVDETMRFDPPVQNTRRFAAEPMQLDGVDLPAGAAVLLVLGAAGRDPALNPDPDTFRVDRPDRRTLGFGWGPHACPGSAIARAIAVAALAECWQETLRGSLRWGYRPSVNARIPVFESPDGG